MASSRDVFSCSRLIGRLPLTLSATTGAKTLSKMGEVKTLSTDYAKQPYPLSRIKGSLSLSQQKILVGMMDILDERVGELLKRRPAGMKLFNAEDLDADGNIVIDIPLSSVTSRPDEYRDIEKVAPLLVEAKMEIDRGDSIEYMNSFTSLIVPKSRGKEGRRRGMIQVKMSQYQANTMFDYTRWAPFRTSVAHHCSGSYTLNMYLTLAEERFRGECDISYSELRQRTGCDIFDNATETFVVKKYKEYKNFHLRVLQSAEKELKKLAEEGWSDFYFSFTPLYKGKASMRTDPEKIHFVIHKTQQAMLEDASRKLTMRYISMEQFMIENFGMTKADCSSILKLVEEDNAEQFDIRMKEIDASIRKQGEKIKDKRKYAIKSLYEAASDFIPAAEMVEQKEDDAELGKEKVTYQITEKDEKAWKKVIDSLHNKDAAEGMELSADEEGVFVFIPTKTFADTFKEEISAVSNKGYRIKVR